MPEARGARLAILGPVGYVLGVDDLKAAAHGVRPLTRLGTINVLLWLIGFGAVGVLGRAIIDGDGRVWFLVALVVMTAVGW